MTMFLRELEVLWRSFETHHHAIQAITVPELSQDVQAQAISIEGEESFDVVR